MSLTAGSRIGPYEIISALGAGGMGEVYRARDTKLGREVAIKALPDLFADDPERIARFEREAQALASLNHPQIAAIYGLEEVDKSRFLVLEYIDGQSLADRLAAGRPQLDEALTVARQILDALEAAHEKGIIHRDLKPANIMLTADGQVKVLDFGLARIVESDPTSSTANSPTLTVAATQMGVIIGTAAYMSPEQAKGRVADKRSDVWAFGCVLYEMLTGRRLFDGEDISETLAAVLRGDPDWSALPAETPPGVRTLLKRCLERDRKARVPEISTVRYLLQDALVEPAANAPVSSVTAPRPWWKRAAPVALAAIASAAIVAIVAWYVTPPPPRPITRFVLTLPADQPFTNAGRRLVAISPDGTQMVYVAANRLYLRSMSAMEAKPIEGTEALRSVSEPVFSPDGQSIAFYSIGDATLKRIPVTGGASVTICSADNPYGMSWGDDGLIFGQGAKGILRVSQNGGTPEVIVSVKEDEVAHGPQILPGGAAVLFTLATGTAPSRWDTASIVVQVLSSGQRKTLVSGGSDAHYIPTGHLLYAIAGRLFAIAFDPVRLEVTGGPVPVVEGVRRSVGWTTGSANYSVSATGNLMYLPGPLLSSSADLAIGLADRKGALERLKLEPGAYESPRASPDGKRIAFGTVDDTATVVWTYDLSGRTAMQRLTFGGNNRFPIWSSDGGRIAFQSDREGDLAIWWQPADGTGAAERLTKPEPGESHVPESWSPMGDLFLFSVQKGNDFSLWMFSVKDRKATPFGGVRSSTPPAALFSPDGRWVAYVGSDQSNVTLYVQPFPPTGARYQLFARPPDGPHEMTWSPDGKELFYNPRPGGFEVVTVTTEPTFAFGNPTAVPRPFSLSPSRARRAYDVMPDGRFLALTPVAGAGAAGSNAPGAEIHVVLNWLEELKARMRP
jgi:serine/threonine-protein kinase